ncbi:transketolase [bacterium]|nr:transketolase [bacterium]
MKLSESEIKKIEELCLENRKNILDMVYTAASGHIGGSLSSCEIMTVLFHKCMKHALNGKLSKDYNQRDRFVLSKGHVSPIYYSVLSQLGFINKSELKTFRMLGSRLQGHPSLWCPGVEVATGSLGQGLSIACGIALSLKMDKNPAKVFVLLGDGELQEGNVWEAFMQAPARNLDNIIAIIDRNRLQIDGCTEDIKPLDNLVDKLHAFNWNVIEIDGHNIAQIFDAIENAKKANSPTVIVANTIKGKGVSFMENNAGWHGKAPSKDDYEKAILELK